MASNWYEQEEAWMKLTLEQQVFFKYIFSALNLMYWNMTILKTWTSTLLKISYSNNSLHLSLKEAFYQVGFKEKRKNSPMDAANILTNFANFHKAGKHRLLKNQ